MGTNCLKGVQINVNHCLAAHSGAFVVARDLQLDFLAIQDPYLYKGEPPKTEFGCRTYMSESRKSITYVFNKNFNSFFKFNTTNSVVIEIHYGDFILNVFNCYFPPHDDIDLLLEEFKDFKFTNSFNLLVGDFNCRSCSWGYDSDNYRGRRLSEFIASNCLQVCNIADYGPTFINSNISGFPDLTLINTSISNFLKNWGVLDMESHSDHKYIYFQLNTDNVPEADFFFKSKYGLGRFTNYIKKHLPRLKLKLINSDNKVYLNALIKDLVEVIQKAAFKSLKKKSKKLAQRFSFWNEGLRIKRNEVSKLFKSYMRLKASALSDDVTLKAGIAYRRVRAEYKKLLLYTKRKAWETYCVNYNERYGTLFNIVFNKFGSNNEIAVNPNNDPNYTVKDKITFIMSDFFPGQSSEECLNYIPIIGPTEPLTIEDLELVFGNLKGGKAPGLDKIDYRMWRAVFNLDKDFILDLFNLIFKLNYFPLCLRNARIFFLLKDGKDPGLCSSYRPVCLLPTLGKIIERLFASKLNRWLDRNNIIHHNQYGFLEGKSCDLAITQIVETIKSRIATEHLALVSLDIKSAFDNMNWPVLFKILSEYGLPKFFTNFLFYYLDNRKVFYVNDIFSVSRQCYRGCPQGSVIAPILWNIYINSILNNNNDGFYIQAFADGLALVVGGRTARELEKNTNMALEKVSNGLDSLKLSLSIHKCQAVVYRSIISQKLSRRNSTVLNRKPTFKIKNASIKVTDSLKILGIHIDQKLSWTTHINSLHNKVLILTTNFNRIIKTDWSVDKKLIKSWYLTTIEKSLLYGASVWGGAITKTQADRLHSIQRVFLIKFLRGYRTTSTNVLNVLSGIPPLHITAEAEFKKFQIWVRRSNTYNEIIDSIELDSNINIKNMPSDQKFISPPEKLDTPDFEVYTDGSRMEDETGLAVCTFQENNNIHNFLFKLKNYNSVFQAELAAIKYAANWAFNNQFKINVFTDSLSSIMALKSAHSRSKFVNSVKQDLFRAKGLVGLSWVKAHVGIPGNEWADQQAKRAITTGEELTIPAPRSYLNRKIKAYIFHNWSVYWNKYDSASGIRVRNFIGALSPKFLIENKILIYFLSGHGPFPYYLYRFKKLNSPLCVCGQVGDADHYVFICSLTKDYHLPKPADAHKRAWFLNLINNKQAIGKMSEAFRVSWGVCNSLTSPGDI
ncbi:Retrovirus-related Pol polyprotein from type-1 retrotransposable element R1 [Araneus ventricosus]|uniref:Retrovirus-related Pol polyprotein from type-1 retrotransposable element R1 n=1 Tax=Araneus ventricosus TaxID=182803 RepID=A0A4Y2AVH8_ARAVE|nr:Retrovirus-related Pol polyprotein from type-1 retrotransposable element R1 [Araneus ventricosus]